VGAAVGTGAGLTVPLLLLRPREGPKPALQIVPTPGGLALAW
jgi:hypothetical protein